MYCGGFSFGLWLGEEEEKGEEKIRRGDGVVGSVVLFAGGGKVEEHVRWWRGAGDVDRGEEHVSRALSLEEEDNTVSKGYVDRRRDGLEGCCWASQREEEVDSWARKREAAQVEGRGF
jgi:hypothetical protein